jgi:hypothetical protein
MKVIVLKRTYTVGHYYHLFGTDSDKKPFRRSVLLSYNVTNFVQRAIGIQLLNVLNEFTSQILI